MKAKKTGTVFDFVLEGSIGESSPLFGYDLKEASQVNIDAEKMTYINSIGVKNWILWSVKIPRACKFILRKAPLVMINQAATVVGFLPLGGYVESFNAPYACDCGAERMVLLTEGKDYHYATPSKTREINLPEVKCAKCAQDMEPDFLEAKVFTFLDARKS